MNASTPISDNIGPPRDTVELASKRVAHARTSNEIQQKSVSHIPGLATGLAPLAAAPPFKYSEGTLGTLGLTPELEVFE